MLQNHLPELQEKLQSLTYRQDRSLAALSLLTAKQFNDCPTLVRVSPISVEDKDLTNPMNWIRNARLQKYKVAFICAHLGNEVINLLSSKCQEIGLSRLHVGV